jgi:hypothetical protein
VSNTNVKVNTTTLVRLRIASLIWRRAMSQMVGNVEFGLYTVVGRAFTGRAVIGVFIILPHSSAKKLQKH